MRDRDAQATSQRNQCGRLRQPRRHAKNNRSQRNARLLQRRQTGAEMGDQSNAASHQRHGAPLGARDPRQEGERRGKQEYRALCRRHSEPLKRWAKAEKDQN